MSGVEMILVRQGEIEVSPEEIAAWRSTSLKLIDGMNRQHQQRWRRFLAWVQRVESGEYLTWTMLRQRSSKFHRRHMKMEQTIFDSQERFDDFEQFRNWLKVGAGFVDWFPGPKGAVVPIPKSMSYVKLGEDGMQELHVAIVRFLRSEPRVPKALWPHLGKAEGDAMIDAILQEFNE